MTGEHLDVIVVGAGISGISAACHLVRDCPDRSFAVLEARERIGGTWDLFRYPGIRSDSDMFTFGYEFAPWRDPQSIADGPAIREYLAETVRAHGVDARIRFGHRVTSAEWSSAEGRWSITVETGGDEVRLTCSFFFVCTGYFRYDQGYVPDLPGLDDFRGDLVHPQHWPEDLAVAGRRVVVIGSGATAVTLVPALAERGARVTMLQRSPTYISSRPRRDRVSELLHRALPARGAFRAVRAKNVLSTILTYRVARRFPGLVRAILRREQRKRLPAAFIDRHLTPRYDPWDERLCLAPDGDIFEAVASGAAEIVTDTIERITPDGVLLCSGAALPADVLVTATGLSLLPLGGMALTVDGAVVDLPRTVAYKGMMLSGVPNFALTIGYTNASWTLKADLVAGYVCRLLNRMNATGDDVVIPVMPDLRESELEPLLELTSGYVRRSLALLPRQGPATPWRLHQNYLRDRRLLRRGPLTDGVRFARTPSRHHAELTR